MYMTRAHREVIANIMHSIGYCEFGSASGGIAPKKAFRSTRLGSLAGRQEVFVGCV